MAKTASKEVEAEAEVTTEQLPATSSHSVGGPSPELLEKMKRDKGKGVSQSASDNLVPLIYILQPLSPQVAKRNAEYIEGAEPGAFWLRNAPHPIVSGEIGMVVQPCYFFKDWVEWRPRESGGGFIARHPEVKEDKCPVEDAEHRIDGTRQRWIRPNGNEVIQTRNHVIRVFTDDGVFPYILPFTSTGHTTSRAWSQLINSTSGSVAFAAKYRLTTRERTNQMGTWFAVDVKFDSWANQEYDDGLAMYEAFARGDKKAAAPDTSNKMDDDIPF
jgi:hypothetical protein